MVVFDTDTTRWRLTSPLCLHADVLPLINQKLKRFTLTLTQKNAKDASLCRQPSGDIVSSDYLFILPRFKTHFNDIIYCESCLYSHSYREPNIMIVVGTRMSQNFLQLPVRKLEDVLRHTKTYKPKRSSPISFGKICGLWHNRMTRVRRLIVPIHILISMASHLTAC